MDTRKYSESVVKDILQFFQYRSMLKGGTKRNTKEVTKCSILNVKMTV